MAVFQNQVTTLWIVISLNKVRDFCLASCHLPLPFVFIMWSWWTWYAVSGTTSILICSSTNSMKSVTDAGKLMLYTWVGQLVCAGVRDSWRDRDEETSTLWLWSQAQVSRKTQWWTVMRKRKRISSARKRCTTGRKRGSGEAVLKVKKWARWRGGNSRQTERNKHEMVKRNKDREREPTQDEKGRALRSVYMDRCTRSQDIGVNPKQLSWRNLQHIHAAGEEQEQPRVLPWISCRAHKWGEGWAVPWSTACRVTPHSGCPGGKLPLSNLGIGQKQTLVWNNMEPHGWIRAVAGQYSTLSTHLQLEKKQMGKQRCLFRLAQIVSQVQGDAEVSISLHYP